MNDKVLRTVCALGLAAFASACHDPDKYSLQSTTNPSGTPIDSILAMAAVPTTVPADGVTRTVVTAHIDSRSTTRSMTFETSLGTLLSGIRSSATEGGKLTLTADDTGTASVDLKSDAVIGTAHVSVTVGGVVRVLDVPFVPVTIDGLLTLELSASSIPADGFSMAEVTARVKTNGDPRQQVKFSTSLGSLVTSANDATNRSDTSVTANAEGVARIFLRSENTVGAATVRAEVLGFARDTIVTFDAVNPNNVITLRASPSPAQADGLNGAGTRLIATIGASIPQRLRAVTFTTTAGQFASDLANNDPHKATVTADAGNVAAVQLVSGSTGFANITATVSGVSARTTVEFVRAQPDTIFVRADSGSVTIAGGNSVMLTVFLTRNTGQVSDNTVVTYAAVDSAGHTIGTFTEATLATVDNDDPSSIKRLKATVKFNPDDTAATGTAKITATVGTATGAITIQLN